MAQFCAIKLPRYKEYTLECQISAILRLLLNYIYHMKKIEWNLFMK